MIEIDYELSAQITNALRPHGGAWAALVFAQEATPAMPDKLTALAGPDGPEALAMMGLSPVEEA